MDPSFLCARRTARGTVHDDPTSAASEHDTPGIDPAALIYRSSTGARKLRAQTESKRDQEEGGGAGLQVSPEEIKSRAVELGLRVKTSFASVVSVVCDSVLHSSWDSNCVVR